MSWGKRQMRFCECDHPTYVAYDRCLECRLPVSYTKLKASVAQGMAEENAAHDRSLRNMEDES